MLYGHRLIHPVILCALFVICTNRSAVGKSIRHHHTARLVSSTNSTGHVHHWGYEQNTDEYPPQAWENDFPACKGARQSPIAISTTQAKQSPYMGPLQFQSYAAHPMNNRWTVINNGHSVQFSGLFDPQHLPSLRKGGLPAMYSFAQFHFHWGNTDSRGSEHAIDNKRFPLELHIVHRKLDENDAQAQADSTGMAVVGILFELTSEKDKAHKHMDSIVDTLSKVVDPNKPVNVTLDQLTLAELLPPSSGFYRYLGSLTTPPCAEAVEWTVMDHPQKITERQLMAFRRLRETDDVNGESDNYRPLQSLNGRVIQHYPGNKYGGLDINVNIKI